MTNSTSFTLQPALSPLSPPGIGYKQHLIPSLLSDWRYEEPYKPLLDYDSSSWAAEWLLRNKGFLEQARVACAPYIPISTPNNTPPPALQQRLTPSLESWGICHMCFTPKPLLFWLPSINPWVLCLDTRDREDHEGALTLNNTPLLQAMAHSKNGQTHLMYSDGPRTLQICINGDYSLETPVAFHCRLCGWEEFECKPLNLQRLFGLYTQKRFLLRLYPRLKKAPQWIRMLRAWDGLQDGATQREIAETLYGKHAAREAWNTGYRSRIQRLLRSASDMIHGGYLEILRRKKQG